MDKMVETTAEMIVTCCLDAKHFFSKSLVTTLLLKGWCIAHQWPSGVDIQLPLLFRAALPKHDERYIFLEYNLSSKATELESIS